MPCYSLARAVGRAPPLWWSAWLQILQGVFGCGRLLLLYLQERHPKSWLCGARNGQNAHRAVGAGGQAEQQLAATCMPIERVPGLCLSDYHKRVLLRKPKLTLKTKRKEALEILQTDKQEEKLGEVDLSVPGLFCGWQLAAIPNYAVRALGLPQVGDVS